MRAHHAVAGNDDADGVVPHRAAHRLAGHGRPAHLGGQPGRQRAIGGGGAVGDAAQQRPHLLAERAARRPQGQRARARLFPGKIGVQPLPRCPEHGQAAVLHACAGQQGLAEVFLPL